VRRFILVSGGVIYGFSFYGCLKQLEMSGVWNIDDIKAFTASIGSVVSVLLAVSQDWETIDNYLINRPWNELYKTDFGTFVDSYTNCGIFGLSIIEETIKPVLESKDISSCNVERILK
jgi:predicted acylesterase/phospholipase RssA